MARKAQHMPNMDEEFKEYLAHNNTTSNPNRAARNIERRSIPHPLIPRSNSAKSLAALKPNNAASSSSSASSAFPPKPYDKFIPTPANPSHLVDLSFLLSPECRARGSKVLGKAEFLNPGFSIKDRIVRNIIDSAEQEGLIRPGLEDGTTLCAASSGNTGAALAMYCAMRGYRCVVITNDKCSDEKKNSIKAYGATLLIDNSDYMARELELVAQMRALGRDWYPVNQYDNQKNPEAYFKTLAPEIYEQTSGAITHFVAAGSTGGTASGCGRYLKAANPAIEVILADPTGSIFNMYYREKDPNKKYVSNKKFKVEGVGKNSIPKALHIEYMDRTILVDDQDAFTTCHRLANEGGIFVGGSAGLNTYAALQVAEQAEGPATVVTILCDTGIKYLSKVFNDDWLLSNGFEPMPNKIHTDLELLQDPVQAKPAINGPTQTDVAVAPKLDSGIAAPNAAARHIAFKLDWGSVLLGVTAGLAAATFFRKRSHL